MVGAILQCLKKSIVQFTISITLVCFGVFSLVGLAVAPATKTFAAAEPKQPTFVSSKTCSGCHQKEYAAWRDSHHGWALRHATGKNVLGDFNNREFVHKGVRSRFSKRDQKFFVETDGPDGKLREFEILYTVGVEPLQQYLVQLSHGRLQALDIAWDTKKKRWFHLYPEQNLKVNDGLHWTGPYKNWNARCAECHQTNFTKGYSTKEKSYKSKWSELTVSCASCHGAGEAHLAWAKQPSTFRPEQWLGVDKKGLNASLSKSAAATELQLCARCHSRRGPVGANSPPPGSKFHDNYRLSLLRRDLYHADGQIKEEVYVFGSFLQSKMYRQGVRCTNCHEPHGNRLIAEGNAVCTQCHSPAGRGGFATLPKKDYDSPQHHHHKAGGAGGQCVSCHMPDKTYMVVDPRRDHSFRVPRPDLSVKIGTPNACTSCHAGKPATWAASQVKNWFPQGRSGTPHFAESFHEHRTKRTAATVAALLKHAKAKQQSAIVRATALSDLAGSVNAGMLGDLVALLSDPSPLVRAAAVRALQRAPQAVRARVLLPLMADPVRAVRLAVAQATFDLRLRGAGKTASNLLEKARREFRESLIARSDYPETHLQLGGIALTRRNLRAANAAFSEVVRQDPQQTDAWLMRSRIAIAQRRPKQAISVLLAAIKFNPDSASLFQALGNAYSQARQFRDAIEALERARSIDADLPLIATDLARAHITSGNVDKAISLLKSVISTKHENGQVLELLAMSLAQGGDFTEASTFARRLVKRYPNHRPNSQIQALLKFGG